ncbi:divergent polysaccharide deacetylase family protein [Magnetovibrio sp. PR-2]|uniref:divergent polysaccharide deacetylase family protein n=1 Tax=Magnetovibrio sp. PR-2 TaxID=3120356 RepID=UPI002FCE413F
MKLPLVDKLSGLGGVFARLNPLALLKKRKGDDDDFDDEDRDFRPSGGDEEDFLGDLGDLDKIESDATERDDAEAEEDDDDPFGDDDDDDDFGGFDDDDDDDAAAEPDILDEYDAEDTEDFVDLDDVFAGSDEELIGDDEQDVPDFELDGFDDGGGLEDDEDADEAAQKAKLKKLLIMAGGGVGVAVVLGALAWWLLGSGDGAEDVAQADGASTLRGDIDLGGLTAPVSTPSPTPAPAPASSPKVAPAPAPAASTQPASTPSPTGASPAQGAQPASPPSPQAAGGVGGGESAADPSSMIGQLKLHGLDVQMEPGAGLIIPSVTVASYENVAPWPAGQPLQAAPLEGLTEPGEHGPLPIIAQDGLTPFDAYARPEPTEQSGDPKVAIIITGLGMSRAATQTALNTMPPDVAFALSVYGRGLDFWGRQARQTGHELLLELPAESTDFPFSDPGPNALQSLATPEDNIAQLEWILSRTTGYFGVISVYGSKFLSVEEQVENVMRALKKRGIMYVDGGAQDSLGTRAAYKLKTNWAAVEVTLDDKPGRAAFKARLAEFEELAKRRALSIARVSASPMALELLSVWLRSLNEKGLKLVPVSSLANKQLIR